MWSSDLVLFGALTLLLIVAGTQDWSSREVSNWITIPLFVAGLIACVWRIFTDPLNGFAVAIMILLLTAAIWKKDWMGGADWKVLVGLFGLWPLAGIVSLAATGIYGAAEIIRTRNWRTRIPAVSVIAVAVTLTFFIVVFRITPIIKV